MKTGKQWRQKIQASVRKVSLIDHFFSFGGFKEGTFSLPMAKQAKEPMVNRVKTLTISCRVVTEGHTYLQKHSPFSWRFI